MAHVFQRDAVNAESRAKAGGRANFAADARAVGRIVVLCLLTGALFGIWLAFMPVTLPSRKLGARWRGFMFRLWARGVVKIAGMRLKVSGNPPRTPFLLVSNHLSYMDIVALGAQFNCVFVAKSEVASWPLIGAIGRCAQTIFVDRRSPRSLPRALAAIERAQADGSGVTLFPEGTSTAGAKVAPFKTSLLASAARGQLPVHYVALSYRTPHDCPPAHLSVCWWGEMTFGRHLFALFRLPGFTAEVNFGAQPIVAAERKELAGRLHAAVTAQFTPVVKNEDL